MSIWEKLKALKKEFLPSRSLEHIVLGGIFGWQISQLYGLDTYHSAVMVVFCSLGGSVHDMYGFVRNKTTLPPIKELLKKILQKDTNKNE